MPDLVISNTSPLFYLHRLRHLNLLQKLYQRIIVPEAVVDELNAGRDLGEDVPNEERERAVSAVPARA
jgi:predicted nucleic acid-binding protein